MPRYFAVQQPLAAHKGVTHRTIRRIFLNPYFMILVHINNTVPSGHFPVAQAQIEQKAVYVEKPQATITGHKKLGVLLPFIKVGLAIIGSIIGAKISKIGCGVIVICLLYTSIVGVRDYVMRQDRTYPVDGALFGINMLVNTQNGMVYTYEEIREDLELAGFTQVVHAVDVPSMSAVVTAKKPG